MMSYSRRSRYSHSRSPYQRDSRSVSNSLSRSRSRSRSHDSIDVENPGNNLYVTGLSPRITKRELEKHFSSEGGKVVDVHLVVDPWTRDSRGFGFVTMSTVEEADLCIKYLDHSILEGRVITVEKARRRRGRTPTPGRYLGLRTVRVRRQSRSDSPYGRGYSSDERDGRSHSPYHSRQRYRSRSRSESRSPAYRRRQSYSRSYSPHDRSVSPYYRRRDRSISPYYQRRRDSHYYRSYSVHDRSVSPYYRRRDRSVSPDYRRHDRSVLPYYRSRSPYYKRCRCFSRCDRSVSSSISRSVSPRAGRSSRRRDSCSVSCSPKSTRSYSRSGSPRSRGSSRSPSPSAYSRRESCSRSRSRSYSS